MRQSRFFCVGVGESVGVRVGMLSYKFERSHADTYTFTYTYTFFALRKIQKLI